MIRRSGGTRGTAAGSSRRPRARTQTGGRRRWDPAVIEALKIVVADIPKRERPPETIRVSVIPVSGGYADLRVYRGGLPTRQGLVIHRDLLLEVLHSLAQAATLP
jgi:hypothetical protein